MKPMNLPVIALRNLGIEIKREEELDLVPVI
jgi:hypothetical protein